MYSSIRLLLILFGFISANRSRVHIQMPVEDVEKEDSYMCYVSPVRAYEGLSLVGVQIDLLKDTSHHAAVVACEDVNSDKAYWDCTSQQGSISKGRAIALQALHGQPGGRIEHVTEELPQGVGIELGARAQINYAMLQVHYKHPVKGFSSELVVRWSGVTVKSKSYYMHYHDYGVMIESYIIKNGKISLIGRQSSQPHGTTIYQMENGTTLTLSPGDIIVARCIFTNPLDRPIVFGTAHSDEMCNFGLNFWYPIDAALMYPRTVLRFQDPHEVTWCQNDVYTSQDLCNLSKNVLFH